MHPLSSPSPRRFVGSALVALVTFGVVGAVLAVSQGGDDHGFQVPVPQVGDRIAYEARSDRSPGLAWPFLEAEWMGPHQVLGADGTYQAADQVEASSTLFLTPSQTIQTGAQDPTPRINQTYSFKAGTRDLAALASDGVDIWIGQDGIYAQDIQLASGQTWTRDTWKSATFEPVAGASCLLANEFQGRSWGLGDVIAFRGCGMNGFLEIPAMEFEAVARGTFVDRPSLVFVGSVPPQEARTSAGPVPTEVTLTMLDGIAYPAAVRWKGNGTGGAIVLVGHAEGASGGAGDNPGVRPATLPALDETERRPWGIDDTGTDHPWPLSQAFEESLTDPTFAELRAFFADHPDAYLSAAWDLSAPGSPQWIIEVTGRDESFGFSVQRGHDQFALGVPDASWIPVNQYSTSVFGALGSYRYARMDAPPPSLAPPTLPTLVSLLERWEAYAMPWEAGGTRPTWSLETRCADESCTSAATQFVVGRTMYGCTIVPSGLPESPGFDWRCDGRTSLLRLGSDGTAIEAASLHRGSQFNQELDAEPPARETSWPGGSTGSVEPRVPFSPSQAATTGAVALAVGLAYLLWPLAKGAPLAGLFSRVGTDEVLDHPTRRRVMDMIVAKPGLHFQALARETGLANGALVHHLRTLVNAKAVVKEAGPFYTCYFPRGTDATLRREAPVLKSTGANRVLNEVRRRPGVSIQGLADAAGMAQSTVSYHVQRLAEAGLLTVVHRGRGTRLHAAPDAR